MKTTPYDLAKGGHSVFSLYYHFIHVVRYRKKVFANDAIMDFLRTGIREITETLKFVYALKTPREIQCNFPEVKKELWNRKVQYLLYFLATYGQVTMDVLKVYID
ncbi:MAG: transposase [Thermoplasmataceae archaeon]|jgi:putative transposase